MHGTPLPEGGWHCAFHDKPLTMAEQKAGCDAHLYLPDLVKGRRIDAIGDERGRVVGVVYRLADGSQWVDGVPF